MLYRSRISRSRFTWSNSFGASIMFFTSGRPTRSIRTLNSPRVRVSATTPTSAPPGRKPVSISTTMLSTFLPSRKIDPGSVKASFRVAIVARAARASMMNGSHRTPAKTRMPRAAPARFVVDAEGDVLPARGHAGPVLLVVRLARDRVRHVLRGIEDAVEDHLLVSRDERPPGLVARRRR